MITPAAPLARASWATTHYNSLNILHWSVFIFSGMSGVSAHPLQIKKSIPCPICLCKFTYIYISVFTKICHASVTVMSCDFYLHFQEHRKFECNWSSLSRNEKDNLHEAMTFSASVKVQCPWKLTLVQVRSPFRSQWFWVEFICVWSIVSILV